MSAEDTSANDVGGDDDQTLRPMEALDSDEVRNNDGDDVVDPPERWIEPKEDETLDERLSDELPDVSADTVAGTGEQAGDTDLLPDDDIDHIDPDAHGTDEGQVSGTPEDGDSLFPVVE